MDGVIVLNKPKGWTSNDCVIKARHILGEKKIGHTGTLDPNVTGVLPLCLGKYTKLVDHLMALEKTYEAQIIIGLETETEDITGAILNEEKISYIDSNKLDSVLESFIGDYSQIPPMYSAIKYQGKRLYEYARLHQEVKREPRNVKVFSIKRVSEITYKDNKAFFTILVEGSKGLYIRTLATDIGKRIGHFATMGDLERKKSGVFSIENSCTMSDLESKSFKLLTVLDLFPNAPKIVVSEYLGFMIKNGIHLDSRQIISKEPFLVYNEENKLIALYDGNDKCDYAPILVL